MTFQLFAQRLTNLTGVYLSVAGVGIAAILLVALGGRFPLLTSVLIAILGCRHLYRTISMFPREVQDYRASVFSLFGPPRFALLTLYALLPRDVASQIEGDLRAEYHSRVIRYGVPGAKLWCWLQVVCTVPFAIPAQLHALIRKLKYLVRRSVGH